jgi:hypothetical protein
VCYDDIAVQSGHVMIQWMSVPLVVKLSCWCCSRTVLDSGCEARTAQPTPQHLLCIVCWLVCDQVIRSLGERSWLQWVLEWWLWFVVVRWCYARHSKTTASTAIPSITWVISPPKLPIRKGWQALSSSVELSHRTGRAMILSWVARPRRWTFASYGAYHEIIVGGNSHVQGSGALRRCSLETLLSPRGVRNP